MHILLQGWEDGAAVHARLDSPDRAQVQAADIISFDGLPGGADAIKIQQRPGGTGPLGVGATTWDGALVMAAYLCHAHPSLAGKRVIELGAGTGAVGILAAALGASVTLTDLRQMLPLLRGNAARNWLLGTPKPGTDARKNQGPKGKAAVVALDWDDPNMVAIAGRIAQPPPDLVVAADCCYVDPGGKSPVAAKFAAAAAELAGPDTDVLVAHEIRLHADTQAAFIAACGAFFSRVELIRPGDIPLGFRVKHIQLYRLRI